MNRRIALYSAFALSGLLARGLRVRAQTPSTRAPEGPEPSFQPAPGEGFAAPGELSQAGHRWRIFNTARYVNLPHSEDTRKPEQAMVDWIMRRTGGDVWHGEDIAVLSATPTELRVFHNPEVLEQVTDIAKRFLDAVFDELVLRVRIVVAADTRWRYAVYSQLEPKGRGPMGQQMWLVDMGTAEMALAQMGINQSFRKVYDQRHKLVNGQTLYLKTSTERSYYSGLERASTTSLGYEPKVEKLEEGVELRASPLLNYDGTGIDLALDLRASSIRKLHATKVIAPRRIGPAEMNVDVPEFGSTRLNQTIPNWPLDRTLVISAGVLPGILEQQGGFMSNIRIPGFQTNAHELLVLFDVSTNLASTREDARAAARRAAGSEGAQGRTAPASNRSNARAADAEPARGGGFRPIDPEPKDLPSLELEGFEPEPTRFRQVLPQPD